MVSKSRIRSRKVDVVVDTPLRPIRCADRFQGLRQVGEAGHGTALALDRLVEIHRLIEGPRWSAVARVTSILRAASCSLKMPIPARRSMATLSAGSSNSTAAWQTS